MGPPFLTRQKRVGSVVSGTVQNAGHDPKYPGGAYAERRYASDIIALGAATLGAPFCISTTAGYSR